MFEVKKHKMPHSVASIAKTNSAPQIEPLSRQSYTENYILLPTILDKRMVMLWLGYVLCFTLLSVALQITHTTDMQLLIRNVIETFVLSSLIVSAELLFISLSTRRFEQLNWNFNQIAYYLLTATFIIVPCANFIGRIVLFGLMDYTLTTNQLLLEMAANIVLTCVMLFLLITYFNVQYQRFEQQSKYIQQLLIEQNEQLKARITPHFFFNMLNTMQYLIETDRYEAEKMVSNVSALYRASFDETKEVALLDEIELCKRYLDIEKYRFADKLKVTWELPDEDLLYDMVISSLTLQLVIEKMIVLVVEMTTDKVHLNIFIEWIDDQVTIEVSVNIPTSSYDKIIENIEHNLSFDNQTAVLRHYYGESAVINYDYWIGQVSTYIHYPLKDVAY